MGRFEAVQTLLFDLGDTLLYFDGDWQDVFDRSCQALVYSLRQHGLALPDSFSQEFQGRLQSYYIERENGFVERPVAHILQEAFQEQRLSASQEQLQASLAAMHRITQAHWLVEEDALPTLERLRQAGYRMGLVSNAADDPNTQVLVDKGGFRPYFEVILSSASQGIRKPDARIFRRALNMLDAAPEQTVMIGDTLLADIQGAHNAGMQGIWVKRRADKPANRLYGGQIIPDGTVDRLDELPQLLKS